MLGSGSGSGSGKDNGKGKGKGKEKAKATASPPPPRGQRRTRQSTSSPSQSPPSQNFNHPSHDNRSAPRAQFPSGFQGNRQPNLPTLTHREQLPPFRGLRDIADAHPQNALQFRAPGSHAPNLQAPSLLDQDPSALKLPPIRNRYPHQGAFAGSSFGVRPSPASNSGARFPPDSSSSVRTTPSASSNRPLLPGQTVVDPAPVYGAYQQPPTGPGQRHPSQMQYAPFPQAGPRPSEPSSGYAPGPSSVRASGHSSGPPRKQAKTLTFLPPAGPSKSKTGDKVRIVTTRAERAPCKWKCCWCIKTGRAMDETNEPNSKWCKNKNCKHGFCNDCTKVEEP
jgi:hypothetical protein